jgi:diguanylate cyclase (GGDEF)-like protein
MTPQTQAKIIGLHNEKPKFHAAISIEEMQEQSFAHLSQLMQQSIDLEVLINSFYEQLNSIVKVHSMNFQSRKQQFGLSLGQPKRHHCQYQIKLEGELLADMQFTKSKRFSESELGLIEQSLSYLVYPIKNALLYHSALTSALLDPLSGLNNRRSFEQDIEVAVSSAKRYQQNLAMLVIDIDHFKKVNDEYGHATGDQVLRSVADVIKESSRRCDSCYRFGGEEFVVLLKNSGICGARLSAERIKHALSMQSCLHGNHEVKVTVSIGISELTGDSEQLFNAADAALYLAKSNGRNRIQVASENLTMMS